MNYVWYEIRKVILDLSHISASNEEFLPLHFPTSKFEKEIIWLLESYFCFVWNLGYVQQRDVIDRAQLFSFLKYKYRISQLGARVKLDLKLIELLMQPR